jgi:RNA polymerase sigma factor (sigma-70 family)
MDTLFDLGALGAMPDPTLLDHFARGGRHSEAAFATLVERHGPMVLGVCGHVLADRQLAEDAFQVTFLLLARRARSIHDPDRLAAWLHRVARRVALRARAGLQRRTDRERSPAPEIAVSEADSLERDEIRAIVHEEIDRLAYTQRLPILLCALQGLSHGEAAERLRWPVGTVKSRLVRGRRRLQSRLARRGLAPAVTLAAILADSTAPAAPVPLALAMATMRAALQSVPSTAVTASAVSGFAASLLQTEVRAMVLAKIWLAAGIALVGAAATLIALAVVRPLPGDARALAPKPDGDRRLEINAPIVPKPDLETPPVIGVLEQADRVIGVPGRRPSALDEQVDQAIGRGVQFLKAQQQPDGSWRDVENDAKTGMTSLITLALVEAGEKRDSPAIEHALEFLRKFAPDDLKSTYAISLQTMAFAAVEPERNQLRIAANVAWLERAQIQPGDPQPWPGSWTYSDSKRGRPGDNSNTQHALLGLQAAGEAGVVTRPSVWQLARGYWERAQKKDGGWTYTPDSDNPTASMTCAGIASLITLSARSGQRREFLEGDAIRNCGVASGDTRLQNGVLWLTSHFNVGENFGSGKQWRYYYLYGLARAGRLAGARYFGRHDWYRLGAQALLQEQDRASGSWKGVLLETDQVLSTGFAVLFLAKGKVPVLINKLRYGPSNDGDIHPDDIRNLVGTIARDWKRPLNWQTIDSKTAAVDDLLRAPILFISGHKAPELAAAEKQALRAYVERGGGIVAEACCGNADFDMGFGKLVREMFPEKESRLEPLPAEHALWRSRFRLEPDVHPLWGVRRGGKTVIIYSPAGLSCYWNESERSPFNAAVVKAIWLGKNIVEYLTRQDAPPKEQPPEPPRVNAQRPREALRIAKLKHAGDWNIAPQAIPKLIEMFREPPLQFNVAITQKDLSPRDPNLIYYPLLYMSGRAAFKFPPEDLEALRRHFDPGSGTLFADAAGGSPAFDAAFRRFVTDLVPGHPLVPIPHGDEIYTDKVGFKLNDVQYTKAAGGGRGFPRLEGVKLKDHWLVIYSKLDIGTALEGHIDAECKGYTRDSAAKIAGNILIYSILP